MSRDPVAYLDDILQSIVKIELYIDGMTAESFFADDRTVDAVVRNLEIIGEAVKKLPEVIRRTEPGIDWKKIAGMRDILIHAYFGIDEDILWDILQTKLSPLRDAVQRMLNS